MDLRLHPTLLWATLGTSHGVLVIEVALQEEHIFECERRLMGGQVVLLTGGMVSSRPPQQPHQHWLVSGL